MKRFYPFIILMIVMGSLGIIAQEHPSSASYVLIKGHFSSAGGYSSSTNYNIISSMGQVSPVGNGSSSNYKLYSGLFTPLFASYNSIPTITNLSAMPQADFTASSFPYTVTFYVSVADIDSSIFDYTWDFGDGNTSQNLNQGATLTITHQYAQAKNDGPYAVTCTVSDKLSSSFEMIDIYLGPQAPKVSITAYPIYGSRPLNVTFTGSATDPDNGTITNYEWNFGDGSGNQSGVDLTNTTHTYSQVVTATTIYTVTLSVTDNDARVGVATQEIQYIPSIFFDDFEDGNASDWTQYVDADWSVVSNITQMYKTPVSTTARHTTAPIPGNVISYGTIRADMYISSASTTELRNGLIIWAFNSYQDYRYVRFDRTNSRVTFGHRAPGDIDLASFAPEGWEIPLNTVFNAQVIVQPDGVVVARINDVTVGSYDYATAPSGMVGLGTRKSETYFDNFLVTASAETNMPPIVTVDPRIYVNNIYPSTVNFTVTADDPDGEESELTYIWKFGDGNTSIVKNASNTYFSEGLFAATLYTTDAGLGIYDPVTTTNYSFINVGVDFYDNFNDGDISDWAILDGAWSVIGNELSSSSDDVNQKILSPYTSTADLHYGMACANFRILPKTTNTKHNAIMIIGYQDTNEAYRFVKFDYDTNTISILHDDSSTLEITDTSGLYSFDLNTNYFACVKVEEQTSTSDKVSVYVNGNQALTYTYSSHWYGKWGLRAGKSITRFDDYVIYDPTTSNSTSPDIDTNYKEINIGEVRTDSPTGQTVQLVIYNKAPQPLGENLVVSSLTINNADFTIEDPATSLPITNLASPIPAGGSANIQIRYKPTVIGTDTAQLNIGCNDPDELTYYVNFQGEGVISLRPTGTINITPTTGSGPIPLIITFSAEATDPDGDDNLITYEWNFGDGSAVNTSKVCSHTYLTQGTFTATLTITDEESQSNHYYKTIQAGYYYFLDTFNDGSISDWTPYTAAYWSAYNDGGEYRLLGNYMSGQDIIKAPSAAEFVDTGIIDVDVYIATVSDGYNVYLLFDYIDNRNFSFVQFQYSTSTWFLKKSVNLAKTTLASGTFIIDRTQWNNLKLEFISGSLTISINDAVIANGVTYGTFNGSGNGVGVYATKAYFDNYRVTFTGISSINQPPTLEINADPTSGYSPQQVIFTATADDPDGNPAFLTYSWNFGDGTGTSTAQNPTYTYTSNGTFTVTCTVRDSGWPSMSATDTVVIEIVEGNHPPNVTIQANPWQGQPPLDVVFTSTVTDDEGNTPYSYSWNFGDGSTSTAANPTHTYTALGEYTATCTVTDSGIPPRSGSATVEIDVSNWLITFEDNYNDNNYTGWTTTSGSSWTLYLKSTGDYALNGTNSANVRILAPATAEFKDGNMIEFDYYVRSGQSVTGRNFGLVFDYLNATNYSMIYVSGKTPSVEIRKIVNGTSSTLRTATIALVNYDTWYHFKAGMDTGAITLELNGVEVITAYSYGAVANMTVGLMVYSSSVLFDNFAVRRDASLDGNTAPQVTITPDVNEGPPSLTVTFTSTVTDQENDVPFTYLWNFGDGSATSSVENPTHTYTITGIFTATCSVTDSGDPAATGEGTALINVSNWLTTFEDDFDDNNYTGWTISAQSAWYMYQRAAGNYAVNGQNSANVRLIAPTATAIFEDNTYAEFDFNIRSGQSVTGKNLGLVFDYIDNSNYSLIYISGKTPAIEVRRYVSGSSTTIYTTAITSPAYDTWYHFRATMEGNLLTVTINGTTVINAYNYGAFTHTPVGLMVYSSSVLFDDFIIKENATP